MSALRPWVAVTVTMSVSTYVVPDTGLRLSRTFSYRTLVKPHYIDAIINLISRPRKVSLRETRGLARVGQGPGERPRGRRWPVSSCLCWYRAAKCTDQGAAGSEDLRGIRPAQDESQTTSAEGKVPGPGSCLGLGPHPGDAPATRTSSRCCITRLPASGSLNPPPPQAETLSPGTRPHSHA